MWRCPLYVPKQPSTLKRLLHLGSFAASSFFPLMAQRRWKPDRIIGVVPTLFCTPGMRLLAKLSGARTVLHIQDYEVDAMLGLGLAGKGKGGKVAQLATAFERSGLHNVDNVSTISRSMMNKAVEGVAAVKTSFSSPVAKSPVFSMSQTPMLLHFVTNLACRITKKSFFTPAILVKSRGWKTLLKLPIACAMNR